MDIKSCQFCKKQFDISETFWKNETTCDVCYEKNTENIEELRAERIEALEQSRIEAKKKLSEEREMLLKNQEERIKANKSDAKEVNAKAKSSVSLNQNVADLFISVNTFLYILGFVLIAIFGLNFGRYGILIVLLGSLILFVSWGAFAIIAEIYKNLKEINAKIKSPDKD